MGRSEGMILGRLLMTVRPTDQGYSLNIRQKSGWERGCFPCFLSFLGFPSGSWRKVHVAPCSRRSIQLLQTKCVGWGKQELCQFVGVKAQINKNLVHPGSRSSVCRDADHTCANLECLPSASEHRGRLGISLHGYSVCTFCSLGSGIWPFLVSSLVFVERTHQYL